MLHKLLFKFTGRLPCRLINSESGRYLERYYLGRLFGLTFYLHRFVDGDGDRQMHDHPFGWSLALVLRGMYIERIMRHMDPRRGVRYRERFRRAGQLNLITAGKFHQILRTKPNTWTLFMHTDRVKGWGFLYHSTAEDLIIYHQPHAPANPAWWHTAKPGRYAGRAPVDYQPAED